MLETKRCGRMAVEMEVQRRIGVVMTQIRKKRSSAIAEVVVAKKERVGYLCLGYGYVRIIGPNGHNT